MRNNIFKSIFISLILVLGRTNAWGWNFTNGTTIYFDNSKTKWSNIYLRVGHGTYNSAYQLTQKVSGTQSLYKYTIPSWTDYEAFSFANAAGWTNYNSIYQPSSTTKPLAQYKITGQTEYFKWDLDKMRLFIPLSETNKEYECQYFNTEVCYNDYKRTVKIQSPIGGTISITYKDESNASQTRTSDQVEVAQTCILTVCATANKGYKLQSISISDGTTLYSGDTYIVRSDITISAEFVTSSEQIVYLKPTGYWNNDKPTFVAHVWNNSSNEDIPMTAVGSEYYTCIIPEGYHSILFFRKSTDGKDIWNQTSDLTIPAHRANCYTIKSIGEGTTKKATGKWNELMLRRRHHNATQQVYDTTGIDIVNSTITFHKDIITNSELSVYERSLYWISFPFDITLNNAFGFGNYGEHWIIEYYDGAERAEKGLWSDASYWKYITDPNYTLKAGVGYVLCLDIDAIIRDDFFNTTDNISLYFPSNNVNLITQITVPEHICDVQRPTEDRSEEDSNWNIIGVPSYTDIANLKNGTSFYYQWNATDNTYTTQDASASTFQVMHAYMVQFAGTIDWEEASVPAQIAARRNTASKDQYTLRLALQQEQQEIDHTFIRLQAEDATSNFDLNTDLTKIINNKTSLYSLIDDTHEAAANVLPMQAATIPLGIEVATDGDYTLSMPDGTDGISAILLDYQMGTQTNMLLSEYKITLEAGIYTNRFALIVDPQQTATEIGHPHINSSDDVHKYIINGQLFIQSGGNTYDIQGRRVK